MISLLYIDNVYLTNKVIVLLQNGGKMSFQDAQVLKTLEIRETSHDWQSIVSCIR